MKIIKNFFKKKLFIRFLIITAVSIFFVYFLLTYINTYLNKPKATSTTAALFLYPNQTTFSTNEIKEFLLKAQFSQYLWGEKLDYFKTKIIFPKDKLQLADYIDTSISGLGRQMRVDGPIAANASGVIIIEIGAMAAGAGPSTDKVVDIAKIKFKANSNINDSGEVKIDESEIVNNKSQIITVASKNGFNFIISYDNNTLTITPIITNTLTITPRVTNTPTQTTQASFTNPFFNLLLKFQGINKKVKDEYGKMVAKVSLKYDNGELIDKKEVELTADEKGFWYGKVGFENIDNSRKLRLYIKGPKHLQKRICSFTPNETYPGSYSCNDAFNINQPEINVNTTGIFLLAGDIDQDGIISAYDIAYVRNNLGQTDQTILKLADFNLDGIVDSQDYSLIIAALSVKSDEE